MDAVSTTVEIYMVNSTLEVKGLMLSIYNSRNLYGQFDMTQVLDREISTTVEIYMVNSTNTASRSPFGDLQQ